MPHLSKLGSRFVVVVLGGVLLFAVSEQIVQLASPTDHSHSARLTRAQVSDAKGLISGICDNFDVGPNSQYSQLTETQISDATTLVSEICIKEDPAEEYGTVKPAITEPGESPARKDFAPRHST